MAGTWSELSKEISQAVEHAGRSIVAVDGRSGHTSSGIVWRADSILTAAHSIRSDTNLRVIAGPGKSITARLSGRDRGTDLAILKLDKEIENPAVQFGNTASLSVGELTVAIARTRRGNWTVVLRVWVSIGPTGRLACRSCFRTCLTSAACVHARRPLRLRLVSRARCSTRRSSRARPSTSSTPA